MNRHCLLTPEDRLAAEFVGQELGDRFKRRVWFNWKNDSERIPVHLACGGTRIVMVPVTLISSDERSLGSFHPIMHCPRCENRVAVKARCVDTHIEVVEWCSWEGYWQKEKEEDHAG